MALTPGDWDLVEDYDPKGFALDIFNKRYTFYDGESWDHACERLATGLASCEGNNTILYQDQFKNLLKKNLFMPGGRIWYGAGRPKGQMLNCFVIDTSDSREGWAKTVGDMIIICGTGGGLGLNASPVRPRGTKINGTGGVATGSVSLMEIINEAGEVIKAGGGRRTALMMSLSLDHGDIIEFLDKKLDLKKLNNANVSVIFNENPELFFDKVRNNEDFELKFNGNVVGKVPAKDLWNKIIKNALSGGEPGVLNGYLANKMSNIYYYDQLETTNPCFAPGTLIQTFNGHFPIEELVGKSPLIFNGTSWQKVDNFRVTGENQKLLEITFYDGSSEKVTPEHTCILEDGTRVKAKDLSIGDRLMLSKAQETHGQFSEPGAYLKGFLIGDGSMMEDRPLLHLYDTKDSCRGRLIESASQIPSQEVHTNANSELTFLAAGENRSVLQGLTPKKKDLQKWCKEYKESLPVEIFAWDKHSKLEFIAGVMDADGTASDTKNGWMYQVSSIHKGWLKQFQTLLKTVGVQSKLGLMKAAGVKDFNDGYGEYQSKDCWRLTISQVSSITLARQVSFSRLVSFANKKTSNSVGVRRNKIVSIEDAGISEKVYCCTVEGSHSLSLSSGNHWGQCGEIWLEPYSCCCLGAMVLPRFISDAGHIKWNLLKEAVGLSVRFLDNVLTTNNYPLAQIQEVCSQSRRIGLGVLGLHDFLLMQGHKYNSPGGLELANKVMEFIKNSAYEASIDLAKEKGSFAKLNIAEFLKSGFVKTLKPSIRAKIKEFGIRNCALLTIAPTGTTSMVCEYTSGIEPMFAPAYRRKYRDTTGELAEEIVVHPLLKDYIKRGNGVGHFQGSHELSMRDHFEMQRICQKHLDNACSKTINVPQGTSAEELSELYMEFLPELKGVTVYPDGSREDQPLTPMPLQEAIDHIKEIDDFEKLLSASAGTDSCKDGKCDI